MDDKLNVIDNVEEINDEAKDMLKNNKGDDSNE